MLAIGAAYVHLHTHVVYTIVRSYKAMRDSARIRPRDVEAAACSRWRYLPYEDQSQTSSRTMKTVRVTLRIRDRFAAVHPRRLEMNMIYS